MSMLKGKLEEQPTHFLVMTIGFTSFISVGLGVFVKALYDYFDKAIQTNTFNDFLSFEFAGRALLGAGVGWVFFGFSAVLEPGDEGPGRAMVSVNTGQ